MPGAVDVAQVLHVVRMCIPSVGRVVRNREKETTEMSGSKREEPHCFI
jgi:hypothetical protein